MVAVVLEAIVSVFVLVGLFELESKTLKNYHVSPVVY